MWYLQVGIGDASQSEEQHTAHQMSHEQQVAAAAAYHMTRPSDPCTIITSPPLHQAATSIVLDHPYQQVSTMIHQGGRFDQVLTRSLVFLGHENFNSPTMFFLGKIIHCWSLVLPAAAAAATSSPPKDGRQIFRFGGIVNGLHFWRHERGMFSLLHKVVINL